MLKTKTRTLNPKTPQIKDYLCPERVMISRHHLYNLQSRKKQLQEHVQNMFHNSKSQLIQFTDRQKTPKKVT